MGDLILIGLLVLVMYYSYKHITGGITLGIFYVLVLLVSYIIYTQVMYKELPGSVNVPDTFEDVREEIEDSYKTNIDYEYREINK